MDTKAGERGFQKTRGVVLRFLKLRSRSEQELRDKLTIRGFSTSIIEQTIQYCKDCGLINDSEFARQWTISRLKKPFGLKRIRIELKQKGIKGKIIDHAFSHTLRDYDEHVIVARLAKKQMAKYTGMDPSKIKPRVYGYLLRRGFNLETVTDIVKSL